MLVLLLDLECFPIARLPASTVKPGATSTSALAATICNDAEASLDMRFPPADIVFTLNHVILLLNLLAVAPTLQVGGIRRYWTACDVYHRIDIAVLFVLCTATLMPGTQVLGCFLAAATGIRAPQSCVAQACAAGISGSSASSAVVLSPWLLLSLPQCYSNISMLRFLRIPAFVPSIQRFFGTIVVGVFPSLIPTVALSVSIS